MITFFLFVFELYRGKNLEKKNKDNLGRLSVDTQIAVYLGG